MVGRPDAVRLAQKQPDNQTAQLLLADHDAARGNWDAAEARFASLPAGLTQLLRTPASGLGRAGAGHIDAALATLRPFVEGQRSRFVYALHSALIADLAGRTAEAARLLQRRPGRIRSPTLEVARLVGSWQMRQGHPAEALETLKATADLNPDIAIALPSLSGVGWQPGDPQAHRRHGGSLPGAGRRAAPAGRQRAVHADAASRARSAARLHSRPGCWLQKSSNRPATRPPPCRCWHRCRPSNSLIAIVRLHRAGLTEQSRPVRRRAAPAGADRPRLSRPPRALRRPG